jgi:hypothetical protein
VSGLAVQHHPFGLVRAMVADNRGLPIFVILLNLIKYLTNNSNLASSILFPGNRGLSPIGQGGN